MLPDLPAGAVVPARGQIIVTQPVPLVLPLGFGTNFDKEYGRQTSTGQLICVDGGQHLAWETPDVAEITE